MSGVSLAEQTVAVADFTPQPFKGVLSVFERIEKVSGTLFRGLKLHFRAFHFRARGCFELKRGFCSVVVGGYGESGLSDCLTTNKMED